MKHSTTETGFGVTQEQITAAANELWRAMIIKPDAEPTAVMVACARMLKAAFLVRPHTESQARDIDQTIMKKIINVR